MTKSTMEHMNDMDSIGMENMQTDKLKEILRDIDKKIEKCEKEKYGILSELIKREDVNR